MVPLDIPMKQIKIICNILEESYLETFNIRITEIQDDREKFALKEDLEAALENVTLKASRNDLHTYRHQVRYMRYQLYFTTTNFEIFFTGLSNQITT